MPGSHSPGPWSARPSERGVPWPPGATFEEQERAFLATGDEFAKIAAIDAWELSKETRALRTLIPASSAATEEGNDGSFIAGARLRALGSLGRLSSEGAARQAAGGALVDVVRAGARDPSPRLLGDALLACDALVELGLKETGTGLVSTFAVKSIPWPLAERVALTLEAIGAAERAEAGKTLSALLAATPNDTFRAMERDDKTRLRELGKRLAGPASP